MGTEYQILFAPNIGAIAIIKDGEEVNYLDKEEIDILVEMLKEHHEY